MRLKTLTLRDRPILERYLCFGSHELCGYAFANIWPWRPLFDIRWAMVKKKFCLFFQSRGGCFMYLPPLGGFDKEVLDSCLEMMEEINHNPEVSRIENIEAEDLALYKKNGYRIYEKAKEYIVRQQDMAELAGSRFKHKRNLCNFFIKNSRAKIRDCHPRDQKAIFALYRRWMKNRAEAHNDEIYQAMLKDSFKVFSEFASLGRRISLQAKVIELGQKIIAYTSGFPVNEKMFCINFEIADLGHKGIAQYLFREFSRSLSKYPELNIMDDSGIETIRQTKLSYSPVREIRSFTALKPE